MKKRKAIHNLDNLEVEIHRLQQAAKETSQQLSNGLGKAGQQFIPLTINSLRDVLRKRKKKEFNENLSGNTFLNKTTAMVADYLKERLKKFF